jgi:hypothetical protein
MSKSMNNQEKMASLLDKIQELLPQVVAKGEIKKLKQVIEILEGKHARSAKFYMPKCLTHKKHQRHFIKH